jgi:hypothetical protein
MTTIGDYKNIMSNHDNFNKIVYTPFSQAINLLKTRRNNTELVTKINKLLSSDIPEFAQNNEPFGVLFRHISTPNNETRHFISILQDTGLKPIICEYRDDLFTPDSNEYKHSLGKIRIHKDPKNGKSILEHEKISIVDFNKEKGKPIKDVITVFGNSLSEFHNDLFSLHIPNSNKISYDLSAWCIKNGKSPSEYYKKFFLLFITKGILFENFLFCKEELDFSEKVILPALEYAISVTGEKPLIVPITPIDIEELEGYWLYHQHNTKEFIKNYNKTKND